MRALVVVAIVAALVVPMSSTANATPDQRDKLVVLAGSAHYLAYAEYPVSPEGQAELAQGSLHVLAAHGVDRDLGSAYTDTDLSSAGHYEFSIVGSMLTAYSPGDATKVQWWDLAMQTAGTGTLPAGARWQGSAPTGWVLVEADNTTLAVQTPTGGLISYGQPLPAEASLPGVIDAISGPHGVVSIGEDLATMAYQRWGSPTHVRPLNQGNPAGSMSFRCSSVSFDVVGCADPAADGPANVSVPLDGSALARYPGCGSRSTALGELVVFVCGTGPAHPRFATGAATVTRSPVKVATASGVSAFGKYVTTAPGGRAIIEIAKNGKTSTTALRALGPVAQLDADSLRAAASAVEAEALRSGALRVAPTSQLPAQILQASADALIVKARSEDRSLAPVDTRAVMGPVPYNLSHHSHRRPRHRHIASTYTLRRYTHPLADRGAVGFGTHRDHGGAHPAPFQHVDGVYVDPRLPTLKDPTIGMVALRAAMQRIGQPYVWAAAGPRTFDCSGLVQWAYAHAGIWLAHFTGDQWNEGRLIRPRDILPGDLILFEYHHTTAIHHVALYLGAGWMLNAPFTGQYVDVVPVPSGVAGVIRP